MIPESELLAIKARADAATPGPWSVDILSPDEDGDDGIAQVGEPLIRETSDGDFLNIYNAKFIASARTDIPRLVETVRMLREGLAGMHAQMHLGILGWNCDSSCAKARELLGDSE